MNAYENADQTSHELDLKAGTCQGVAISSLPDHHIQKVDHVSVDAELFWSEPFDRCNITVHEVPGCVDPPIIKKGIQHRVGVSECAKRKFSPFNQVWLKLDCEEVGGHHRLAHYYRPQMGTGSVGQDGALRNGTMGRVAAVGSGGGGRSGVSHSRPMEKTWKRTPIVL